MQTDIMKMKATHAIALIASTALAGLTLRVNAEPAPKADRYYAGQAAGGQSVVLDLTSISSAGEYSASFIYFLGEERIPSQATCAGRGSWTTIDTGVVYYPRSQATHNMINVVCERLAQINQAVERQAALVYAPPSNVRATPNGRVMCSIGMRSYINVYGRSGEWYYTDACGQTGVIHDSQIRF